MTDVAYGEFQKVGQRGFEAAVDAYEKWHRAFQALATRTTENAKKAFEDTTRTFEQLLGAKSIEQVIEIQSQYAKKAYDDYVAEWSKLGEMYAAVARDAYKPVEKAVTKRAS